MSELEATLQWPFPHNITWSEATPQCAKLGDLFVLNPNVELWFICSYDADTKRTTALKVCETRKRALSWARWRDASGTLELWRSDTEWEGEKREVVYANAAAAREARKT